MNRYIALINEALAGLELPAEPSRLYDPIRYTLAGGGKRLRPTLTLLTCDALGGNIDHAMPAALAIEVFHNFTLLHDDVMDRADVRRHRPTVWRQWDENVAILSGDAMLTFATTLLAKAPARHLPELLSLFNTTAMEIYEGQQWDMDFELRDDVTVDEYINMIRLKTSVLLGCACKAGAIIADADNDLAGRFYSMAVDLGLAFQLQDDYLDCWGDPDTFGKAIGGDIECGKKTFLLINALQRDPSLAHVVGGNAPDKVATVTRRYEQLGVKDLARNEINRYSLQALDTLNTLNLAPDFHHRFERLITALISRDS